MASYDHSGDADHGMSYNESSNAVQRLLEKLQKRPKQRGMIPVLGDRSDQLITNRSIASLHSRLNDLIEFAERPMPMVKAAWRRWKKGHIELPKKDFKEEHERLLKVLKQKDPDLLNRERQIQSREMRKELSSRLDELIQFDSGGPPRDNLGYKIKPLGHTNLYASDEGGIYTPTSEIKPGSDILNYPHLRHGKFTKIIDRRGRATYESRKQAKVMGAIGGGLLGAAGGAAGGYGLHAALEGGRLGRHSGKIGAAYAATGPIVGAAIGYRRGSKKMLPQDKIQNRLSSKLDDIIQFQGDPRPRNNLGEFRPQDEGGPDPNAMVKTYRVAPAQPGMAPDKRPGLLGLGGLALVGGAAGGFGGQFGTHLGTVALDKVKKAIAKIRK